MMRLFMAAIAVFFVSSSMAQEVPRPKHECITASEFLQGYRYSIGYQKRYSTGVFSYVKDMDAVIILPMSRQWVDAVAGLLLKRGMPGFLAIYKRIMRCQGI